MKKKILLTIALILVIGMLNINVYADNSDNSWFNTIINNGNDFGNQTGSMDAIDDLEGFIKGKIMPIVIDVGNLIIACVTIILGAKYIWSGADGKAEVLETLPAFVVGVMFFYIGEGWLTFMESVETQVGGDYEVLKNDIFATIAHIVRLMSFGGLLYMGIKYMLASAEGKSQLKTNMGSTVIGLLLVFSAVGVVEFIANIGVSIIQ